MKGGPVEDSFRLVPNLVKCGFEGKYPEFVDPNTPRDFIYIDDAVEAFTVPTSWVRPPHAQAKKLTFATPASVHGIARTNKIVATS
jgi:hypothetical protein